MAASKRAKRATRVRHLSRVAALTALGRDKKLVEAFKAARKGGVGLRAIRETLLQTYLFAGFPRTVNALEVLEEALGPLRPERPETLPTGSMRRSRLRQRGLALFRKVYGEDAPRVLEDIGRRHLEFRDWIVVDAYGKVLGRSGLTDSERECIAVALLATLNLPRQLIPHVRGALNCGATEAEIASALEGVEGIAPKSGLALARKRLERETTED